MHRLLTAAPNWFRIWLDNSAYSAGAGAAEADNVDWLRCAPFLAMHVACLGVIWVGWSPAAVGVAVGLYLLRMFAITGFYHRYFSHRTFKTSRWFQGVMAAVGCTAVQRDPMWWAAHHVHHHAHSEDEEDPHSPLRKGFWKSHVGWFMTPAAFRTRERYVPDWAQFPELRWLNRYDMLPPIVLAAALFGLGAVLQSRAPQLGVSGMQMLVWGFFVSTIAVHHGTFTINSLAHQFGSRRFATKDNSRNNWLLALITLGEGWHNNHHHYPGSTRQGFYWWEIDLTYYGLKFLEAIGLVWDLRPVPATVLARNRIDRAGGDAMKIAIIGSGISGLTAAYHLHRRHDVTVFEAGDYIGGHTNTIRFELGGEEWAVDTGFIVYNERNYPHFSALLAELGVESQPTSMSFSVRSDEANLEYNGTSLDTLFAQRTNLLRPSFHRMLRDILRFHREAPALNRAAGDDVSVADFVAREGYSQEFFEHYLTPLGSALWSSPPGTFQGFPIRFVVEFLANHSMLQVEGRPTWRVIRGGSYRYVEKLTAGFRDRILLNTAVHSVERRTGSVRLVDAHGEEGRFDHVIFACHSDQALGIVRDPTVAEVEVLNSFPYQANEAVLHTDPSVLPRRRKAWASWNYHVRPDAAERATVTYNMNLLQSLPWKHVFNVTLNDAEAIDPERVIRRILYHHPIFTARRGEAQRRHGELIAANRTSYCGAYWGYGFHEDGVRSALAVCNALSKREEAAA